MSRSRLVSIVPPLLLLAAASMAGCGSSDGPASEAPDASAPITPRAGEMCDTPQPTFVGLRFEPPMIFLQPGQSRTVHVAVDPDLCDATPLSFSSDASAVVASPAASALDLRHPRVPVVVAATSQGDAVLTATIPLSDGTSTMAKLSVHVLGDVLPACAGEAKGKLAAGGTVKGTGGLAGASVSLQAGADAPNSGAMQWHVDAFDVTVGCGAAMSVNGYLAIGPAITIAPGAVKLPREIPVTIPINPALMPETAALRHVGIAYTGPAAKTPRIIPVADPRIDQLDGAWVMSFKVPRLGTYQAMVQSDGGKRVFKRHVTHRAVLGVSMGAGGAASFGTRFHDQFDVVAPLGGSADWTYLLDQITTFQLSGFAKNDGENVPTETPEMGKPRWPYEHPQSFNRWWYEFPAKDSNGGGFDREEYVQLMRDLSYMYGNPFGQNTDPEAFTLPAGISKTSKSVAGDHPGNECAVYVNPYDGAPNKDKLDERWNACPAERCSHTEVLQNYYDDEFNSKGKWPVITVCDGSPQNVALSPWSNTWASSGNTRPLEVGLAVDYNANGVRDENEPIIKAGYEPYRDVGVDGLASKDEPGYQAGVSEDPSGDDYDPQYNPGGLESNGRWDDGEPYDDVGLDGVPNTVSSPYDSGEGDGKFTMSNGLRTFLERDARTAFHQQAPEMPSGPFTDEALRRVDFWGDGGTRDLFNFSVVTQHFSGGLVSRGRTAAYFTDATMLPGQVPGDAKYFVPGAMTWDDLPGVVVQRYGAIDPTPAQVANGSGQHVGTPDEVTRRLQAALYYAGSRWPDAPRWQAIDSAIDPVDGAQYCEIIGNCTLSFEDSLGRVGPVQVTLPSGYAHKDQQDVRYPVIYLLHGYGQTPEDLGAAIVFMRNWMNSPADSAASRMPKAIIVYVDGRCRVGPSGESECVRGTFFAESVRPTGAKIETWWKELMAYVDVKYRTMPPADIDWTE